MLISIHSILMCIQIPVFSFQASSLALPRTMMATEAVAAASPPSSSELFPSSSNATSLNVSTNDVMSLNSSSKVLPVLHSSNNHNLSNSSTLVVLPTSISSNLNKSSCWYV